MAVELGEDTLYGGIGNRAGVESMSESQQPVERGRQGWVVNENGLVIDGLAGAREFADEVDSQKGVQLCNGDSVRLGVGNCRRGYLFVQYGTFGPEDTSRA